MPILRIPALLSSALVLFLTAFPALAQEIFDCDWRASARNIAEPWADNTRTFSNGKTRLTLIDTVEPAAGSYSLMILSPPHDVLGSPQCKLIGRGGGLGYSGLVFEQLEAAYDPARGLIFTLPAMIYLPEENFVNGTLLTVIPSSSATDDLSGGSMVSVALPDPSEVASSTTIYTLL